jgi:squalene-hopene/tetraprenyl-beta-curcumene cyclase
MKPLNLEEATEAGFSPPADLRPVQFADALPLSPLDRAIQRARDALLRLQSDAGYWCFELEADCTIPAEYIMMMHFTGDVDADLQAKLARYIRRRQAEHNGWPLYPGGEFDMSCSVKCYYALKLAGDDPDELHMRRARAAVLARGGAARSNVFTRIGLALFGQVPWRGTPYVPVEIGLLPHWFFFHLGKVSYWSRTVMVPLSILCTLKPTAKNPNGVGVSELFAVPPESERHYHPVRSSLNRVFLVLERTARLFDRLIPRWLRKRALRKAEHWILERLNGEGGLGAIFPAMVNTYEALMLIGYPKDHPYVRTARKAIDDLLVVGDAEAYCQPCVSPIWDTGLACMALHEVGDGLTAKPLERAFDWLRDRQLLNQPGDWQHQRPNLAGGGWPFEFHNDHYPDLDDTGVVGWAMHLFDARRYGHSVGRAADWIHGMQSRNGGFAAFDADNTYGYLNEIPFADHGALLDPPSVDVSARCLMLLAGVDGLDGKYRDGIARCIDYIRTEQEPSGAWFGRWGTNYIYGTWSVLEAWAVAGLPCDDPMVRRAVQWLESRQRPDGGWGESNDSYVPGNEPGVAPEATSFQTAWALLGLMAAGQARSPAVARGIDFLLRHQGHDGLWSDTGFTAPGFPRVFYLKYHGYDKFFPLWALARYRRLGPRPAASRSALSAGGVGG